MVRIIYYALGVVFWWLVVDALASWVVHDPNALPRNITSLLSTPLYAPIRGLIRQFYQGPIDIAPLIVLLGISAIRRPLLKKMQFEYGDKS